MMLGERTLLSAGEGRAFSDRLLGEIERLPGVERAAFASSLPPATSVIQMGIRVVEGGRDETQMMALVAATTAWADAAGARVVDGRFLNPEDAHPESPGVVVSRSAARHLFGNRPAVGLSMPTPIPGSHGRKARVVGVVDDVRYLGLLASPGGAVYVPWEALPFGVVRLVVRTNGDPLNLVGPIRAIARRLDPSRPIEDVQPLRGVVDASVSDHRIYAVVANSLGITSFAVALVGLLATLARMPTKSASKTITRDPNWLGPAIPPGEMLLEEFLKPMGLGQVEAARRLGISLNRLNEIVLGKRGITADTALRLGRVLKTSPQFWMRLQADWDLHEAIQRAARKAS